MTHFVGDPMKLGKLCDGALDGIRIDEIGEAAHGLFLDAIETTGGAIALQESNVPGEPRIDKAQCGLVKREGIACRARSRCVARIVSDFVGHNRQSNTNTRTMRQGYPHRTRCLWWLGQFLHHQNRPASFQSFQSVTHVSFSPGAPCFVIGEGARAIDSATIALRSSMVTGGLILASSFLTITPKCFTILSAFRHPSVFLRSLEKSQSEVTS
jgi:hypothetical protein